MPPLPGLECDGAFCALRPSMRAGMASGAEARIDLGGFRGAEAPLFHEGAGLVVCLKAYPDTNLPKSKASGQECPLHTGNVKGKRASRPLPHMTSTDNVLRVGR